MVDQQQPSRKVDPNFGESPQGELLRTLLLRLYEKWSSDGISLL